MAEQTGAPGTAGAGEAYDEAGSRGAPNGDEPAALDADDEASDQ